MHVMQTRFLTFGIQLDRPVSPTERAPPLQRLSLGQGKLCWLKSAPRAWHHMQSCYNHPVLPAWGCFVVADLQQGGQGPNWLPTHLIRVKRGLNSVAQSVNASA